MLLRSADASPHLPAVAVHLLLRDSIERYSSYLRHEKRMSYFYDNNLDKVSGGLDLSDKHLLSSGRQE